MSIAVSTRGAALAAALAIFTVALPASAQLDADQTPAGAPAPKPAKKRPKKKKPAPVPAAETTPAPSTEPAPVDATPANAAPPPPVDATPANATPEEKKVVPQEDATLKEKDVEDDNTNTFEDPGKRYYFVGARYRGTIIPQFVENLFIDEGRTLYQNTAGVEVDIRKGGQSMIPWLVYADYSMGDTLFHDKGGAPTGPGDPGNFSVVNSSLKAIYAGLDELWSVPIDKGHHWDFEFGFGVGVGFVFGNLMNDWVFVNPNGPLVASSGTHYSECQTFNENSTFPSCQVSGHTGATTPKVGGYVEKNWFQGGAVPVVFPYISFPNLGLRYKPIKQMEARLGVGFSLTGFWFALSADYGLETNETKPPKPSGSLARLHDML
jgi:hypothetical protein